MWAEKEGIKMFGWECYGFEFWWIFPLVMMVLCFFMMRNFCSCMAKKPWDKDGEREREKKV
jgi:hypothetical protein